MSAEADGGGGRETLFRFRELPPPFFEELIPSLKLPEAGQRPAPKDTSYLLRSRARQSGFENNKNK